MSLFKEMLSSEESLFREEGVLEFAHMPKLMPYREEEQRLLAGAMQPLFQKRNGKNIFVYGKPGVGKTLALKKVLGELEEKTDDIIPVYINCWQKNTSFKVFADMCGQLGRLSMQNKGVEDLFQAVQKQVGEKACVFVFDEIDRMEDLDFLYSILEGISRKSVILITNYEEWLKKVEDRIMSRLMLSNLHFRKYSPDETKGILQQRIKYAFVPKVLQDDAFHLLLDATIARGDIRSGLFLLKEAGGFAEERSSRKIEREDASKAITSLDARGMGGKAELDRELRKIMEIVKQGGGLKMGDLYSKYQEQGGECPYRTFFRKVLKLGEDRYVSLDKKSGGAEGSTTIVSVAN
jgi:archaeal cell division control protein 6